MRYKGKQEIFEISKNLKSHGRKYCSFLDILIKNKLNFAARMRRRWLWSVHSDGLALQRRQSRAPRCQRLPRSCYERASLRRHHCRRNRLHKDEAAQSPARACREPRQPVWLLHAWHRHVDVHTAAHESSSNGAHDRARVAGQSLPLYWIQTNSTGIQNVHRRRKN